MTKRLFIAIPISAELQQFFAGYSKDYQHPQIRWVPAENLHITINFLGNTDIQAIPQLSEELKKTTADMEPFILKFDHIIFGPPQRTPSMVWAQYENCSEYTDLVKKIMGITHSRFQHRDTIPHITLARFKNWHAVKDLKFEQPIGSKVELEVSQIQLMESELRRGGAVYNIVENFNF